MAANIINRLNLALQRFEQAFGIIFGRGFPPEALCAVRSDNGHGLPRPSNGPNKFSLESILGDGFLWAVPKSRRTVEKRLSRKFGFPEYNWKPLKPKTLLMCNSCGHHHEAGILCPHCYAKVKLETEEMQAAIQADLGLNPVEKDVVVLYQGEKDSQPDDYWKGKRVVEMPKERPAWFHRNLLQRTTQQPSDSKEVKPTDLA